ncbi:TetR/AcrR family transcriptional regulator [Amycolatopsis sp. 195334CR]|uniref:TetR/AcrR family transcriptional regulator n=1 Tax=Amycolatopsis sp. 195334CR TaxID=2814588 RepID=UPI001A8F16AE|nr:TetR family transcriptional regulator [Amycolatopsis sp. 195334CR]MBN6040988.1 TetR family transcriptional regulator [Amycolatopsis sp. 195334CR]
MNTDRLPLRERKKLQTRDALIGTALELFTTRGFAATTLDELCDAVGVSKRTFFRTFGSKEEVALAPSEDLWVAFLAELRVIDPGGRTVVDVLRATLITALDEMTGEDWAHRVLLGRRLAAETPSVDAHGLYFCERTSRTALEILHTRLELDDPADPRVRLAMDMLVSAFHLAQETWAEQPGEPSKKDFARHLDRSFDLLPESLALTVPARR